MVSNTPGLVRTFDVVLGVSASLAPAAVTATRFATVPVRWTWRQATEPPLVPHQYAPGRLLDAAEVRGRALRTRGASTTLNRLGRIADVFVPAITAQVLNRLDPIELAKANLDLEQIERELDLLVPYATEALLSRIEPVTLIEANLSPEQVEKLLDLYLTDVTTEVLRRLDLTTIVDENVDLTRLTRNVLGQIDIVDLTEMVLAELDLAKIATEVLDEIDLPEIIRESSTGVAGNAVAGARETAASADDLVSGFFGRRREQKK